jgi:hypothetical protein
MYYNLARTIFISAYNITHFDPNDPVIVSEAEIYCSAEAGSYNEEMYWQMFCGEEFNKG